MFLPMAACLSIFVCLSLDYAKSYERILMQFLEGWSIAQRTNDHDADPADPGSF